MVGAMLPTIFGQKALPKYVMSIGRRYKKGERGARGRVDLELCNGEACEFGLGLPESP